MDFYTDLHLCVRPNKTIGVFPLSCKKYSLCALLMLNVSVKINPKLL